MSRMNHKSKGPGYEYWSRRPGKLNHFGCKPGRYTKTHTHRAERVESKAIIREAVRDAA